MVWADTWTENTSVPETDWREIAASATGDYLYAVDTNYPSRIYKSTDGGSTWSLVHSYTGDFYGGGNCIVCSDNGQYVYATGLLGNIHYSSNYGATWSSSGDALHWSSLACSLDGATVYVSAYNEQTLFKSVNYGAAWSEITTVPTGNSFSFVSCSSDGATLYLGATRSVWKSTDSGATFTQIVTDSSPFGGSVLQCVAASDNANTVYIGAAEGLWVSTNGGSTFSQASFTVGYNGFVYSVSCSSDGTHALATFDYYPQPLYATEDSGATWYPVGSSRTDWSVVGISGDASTLVAGVFWGYLFTASSSVAPPASVLSLFLDGFDEEYLDSLTPKWSATSGTITLSATEGRRGGGCVDIGGSISSLVFPTSSAATLGTAVRIPAGGSITLEFLSGGDSQCFFVCTASDGLWKAYDGAFTLIDTATSAMPVGIYRYVEIGVEFGASGTYELKLNESSVLTGSVATTDFDQLRITGQCKIDDLYLVYGDSLQYFGNVRVDALLPDANSTPQDWVPDTGNAWERVAQDAGYITADSVGATSNFSVADPTFSPTSIFGVQVTGYAEGARTVALLTGSTQGGDVVVDASATLLREGYIQNPDTSADWTTTDVDGLEIGVVVTA